MIVAGFGFRQHATLSSLLDALRGANAPSDVDAISTLADKADAAAFDDLSAVLKVPIIAVNAEKAQWQETLTHSSASSEARGTGSVAEACALVAAGPGARLLAARTISTDRMATCALAKGHEQ